eukprot:16223585-Heterocapsa_arctica.AAC.1
MVELELVRPIRAATPAHVVPGRGPVPPSLGQVSRALPLVDPLDPYAADTPARRAIPARGPHRYDHVVPSNALMGQWLAPSQGPYDVPP